MGMAERRTGGSRAAHWPAGRRLPQDAAGAGTRQSRRRPGAPLQRLGPRPCPLCARLSPNVFGFGALTTGLVTVIVVASKFAEGAWIVVLLVPALVWLIQGVHAHYAMAERQLRLDRFPRDATEREQVLIPVRTIDRTVAAAIIYGRAISSNILAIHVAADPDFAAELQARWPEWDCDVPLEIIPSPYREVIQPLLAYIEATARADRSVMLTVLLPQIITRYWWQEALHNQTALQLTLALRGMPNLVVTAVPITLQE
jgi:hypothetical protein